MAFVTLMQDWVTIVTSGSATAIQAEPEWLDLLDFNDLFIYTSTQEVNGTAPILTFATSPSRDGVLFAAMTGSAQALVPSTNFNPIVIRRATSPVLLDRFLRWQLAGSTSVSCTFRVYIAGITQGGVRL